MQNNYFRSGGSSPRLSPRPTNQSYGILQSPVIHTDLARITANLSELVHSSDPNQVHNSKIRQHLQRKKYERMKEELVAAVQKMPNHGQLQKVLHKRQELYSQTMASLNRQLDKECREKGEILRFVWNSMLNLIQELWQKQAINYRAQEKHELDLGVHTHVAYQQLLQVYDKKQKNFNSISKMEKTTISKLVYELRFKRKQIRKLNRNQKVLLNSLNQLKDQNLTLQSKYIDLMSQMKDISPEEATRIHETRMRINESKQVKIKLKGSKKTQALEIKQDLENSPEDMENLCMELRDIANNDLNSPQLMGILLSSALENFAAKNEDDVQDQRKLTGVKVKVPKMDAQTQITYDQFRSPFAEHQKLQFGYDQKLQYSIVLNRGTQTFVNPIKETSLVETGSQVSRQYFKRMYIHNKFKIQQQFQRTECFRCDNIKNAPNIKIVTSSPRKKNGMNEIDFSRTAEEWRRNDDEEYYVQTETMPENLQSNLTEGGNQNGRRTAPIRKGKNESRKKVIRHDSMRPTVRTSTSMAAVRRQRKEEVTDNTVTNRPQATAKSPSPSGFLPPQRQVKTGPNLNTIKQMERPSVSNIAKTRKGRVSRTAFLDRTNDYHIEIDQPKAQFIDALFNRKDISQMHQGEKDDNMTISDWQSEERDTLPPSGKLIPPQATSHKRQSSLGRMVGRSSVRPSQLGIQLMPPRSSVDNSSNELMCHTEMIMEMCRRNSSRQMERRKSRTKETDKKQDSNRQDFRELRCGLETLVTDINDMIKHKQAFLKNSINRKNMKNVYKIIMNTLAKVYDYLNKGTVLESMVFPLFETFSLIYGTVNHHEIYKKMVFFLASISLQRDNIILKFFLFLLGLDNSQEMSRHITISEVYLALKLLQMFSIDAKATINIESVCTDVKKVKEELTSTLSEEGVPEQVRSAVESRVSDLLERSCAAQEEKSPDQTQIKLNIFRMIIIITEEVIGYKKQLRQSLLPILILYDPNKIPSLMVESLIKMGGQTHPVQHLLRKAFEVNKWFRNPFLTQAQLCSVLFESNITHFHQLFLSLSSPTNTKAFTENSEAFAQEIEKQMKHKNKLSPIEYFQTEFYSRLISVCMRTRSNQIILQMMKQMLYESHLYRKAQSNQ